MFEIMFVTYTFLLDDLTRFSYNIFDFVFNSAIISAMAKPHKCLQIALNVLST